MTKRAFIFQGDESLPGSDSEPLSKAAVNRVPDLYLGYQPAF